MFFQNTVSLKEYELLRGAQEAVQKHNEELNAHNKFLLQHNVNLFNENKELRNERDRIAQELSSKLRAWEEERATLKQEIENLNLSVSETESQNSSIDVPGAMMTDFPDAVMVNMEEQRPKRKFPKKLKFWKKEKKHSQPIEIVEPVEPIQVHNNDMITETWKVKKKALLQDLENLRKGVVSIYDKVEKYGGVEEIERWAMTQSKKAVQMENEGKTLSENTDEEFVPSMVSPHTGAIVKSVRLRVKKPNSEQDVSEVPCTSTDLEDKHTNLNRCEKEDDENLDACDEQENMEEDTTQDVPQTSSEEDDSEDKVRTKCKKPSRWSRFKSIFTSGKVVRLQYMGE